MSIHKCKWSDSLVVRRQLPDQAYLDRNLEKAFYYIYECQIAYFFKFMIIIVLIFYIISWWALHFSFIFSRFYSSFPRFPHSFLVSGGFCCLLTTFANSLFPERRCWYGYRPLDTLIVFLKDALKKLILKKCQQMTTKVLKPSSVHRVTTLRLIEIIHVSTCVFVE